MRLSSLSTKFKALIGRIIIQWRENPKKTKNKIKSVAAPKPRPTKINSLQIPVDHHKGLIDCRMIVSRPVISFPFLPKPYGTSVNRGLTFQFRYWQIPGSTGVGAFIHSLSAPPAFGANSEFLVFVTPPPKGPLIMMQSEAPTASHGVTQQQLQTHCHAYGGEPDHVRG
jgi:hypothetical protein